MPSRFSSEGTRDDAREVSENLGVDFREIPIEGIVGAFGDIGRMGSDNLVVVAPGISQALITTAMGLLAAIPAAVFFNVFNSRVKVLSSMLDDFALEFLNIVERNFT